MNPGSAVRVAYVRGRGRRLRFPSSHQALEEDRMRELTIEDIDELTLGATLLGTGGGGDPYIARLMVRQAIEDFGPVQVVDAGDLPPDGRVLTVAVIGAPTVIVEKIPAGT